MSLVLIVYLIGVLPGISAALAIMGGIGMMGTIAASVIFFICSTTTTRWSWETKEDKDKENIAHKKHSKMWIKLSAIPILMTVFAGLIPTEKTMYYMVAAYGVERVIENPEVQTLASDGADVLKQLLAKAKKELAGDAPKDTKK